MRRAFNVRDRNFRKLSQRFELNKNVLKSLFQSQFLKTKNKLFIAAQFNLHLTGFFSKIRNRSIETNRSRSILRSFKISRIDFRSYAHKGYIPGVKKSSW